MTAYASYVYYRDEWCGTLAKEDYDRLSKRASRYLDMLTMQRIQGAWASDTRVKDACCARDGRALQSGGRRRVRRLRKPRLGKRELCVGRECEKPGGTASRRGGAVSSDDGASVLRDGVRQCADSVRIR